MFHFKSLQKLWQIQSYGSTWRSKKKVSIILFLSACYFWCPVSHSKSPKEINEESSWGRKAGFLWRHLSSFKCQVSPQSKLSILDLLKLILNFKMSFQFTFSQLRIMCRKRHFVCLRSRSLEPYKVPLKGEKSFYIWGTQYLFEPAE